MDFNPNDYYSDTAKRCSDAVNNAVHGGHVGKWLAIKLHDGSTDSVAYDRRADAIRHQLHETLCCYIKVPPGGMQPVEAERFMAFSRMVYNAGYRLADPESEATPIFPYTMEELNRMLRSRI
jgi:hypothetical protein